jgi:hypothetical protein
LRFCDVTQPWAAQTQLKFAGFYELPGDFQVSGNVLNIAGPPIAATYVASNAQIRPSLNRDLAAGPAGLRRSN